MGRSLLRALVLLIALGLLAAVFVWRRAPEPTRSSSSPETPAADTPPGHPEAEPPPEPPSAAQEAPPSPADVEGLASAWEQVDLEEIRRAMPENRYWEVAMPTKDPRLIREREEERERWNVEYGKVLSGNASEQEIQAYYAHRQRLSADYVEFAGYVLDHYGSKLSEQDVTLLELARTLHLKRLEQYPREIQQALERKLAQDRAREEWRASEAELGAGADAGK